jgi:hypothetical protein
MTSRGEPGFTSEVSSSSSFLVSAIEGKEAEVQIWAKTP